MSRHEKSIKEMHLNLAASTVTGGLTMACSNWLDCLRIRYQVSAPPPGAGQQGVLPFFRKVVAEEGLWRGLWRPALLVNCGACCGSMGTRIGLYPTLRDLLGAKGAGGADGGSSCGVRMFAAGLCSGTLGYLPWSPLFMIKTQLQSEAGKVGPDGKLLTGAAAGREPTFTTLREGLARAYASGGLRGLYRGALLFTVRGAVLSASQLSCYDATKTYLRKAGDLDGPKTHFVASLIASVGLTVAVMPLDNCFTRFQASKVQLTRAGLSETHPTVFTTAGEIYRTHGLRGFYRGYFAMFARMLPTSVATFYIYEQVRKLLGLAYLD